MKFILLWWIALGSLAQAEFLNLRPGSYHGYWSVSIPYHLDQLANGRLGCQLDIRLVGHGTIPIQLELEEDGEDWIAHWESTVPLVEKATRMRRYETTNGPLLASSIQIAGEHERRGVGFWLDDGLSRHPQVLERGILKVGEPIQLHTTEYTSGAGLSSNAVRCALQTSDGYLWFGTVSGLSRFNGHAWRSFTPENSSLPDENITGLVEDSQGRLIIGTKSSGFFLYEGGEFSAHPANHLLVDRWIQNLQIGPDDTLWYGVDRWLTRVIGEEVASWSPDALGYPYPKISPSEDGISDCKFLEDGRLLVTARRGMVFFDPSDQTSTFVPSGGKGHIELDQGRIYSFSWEGIRISDDQGRSFRDLALPKGHLVRRIQTARGGGGLWVATSAEIYYYDAAREEIRPLAGLPQRFKGSVRAIVEDSEGGIWIASSMHGVIRCVRNGITWLDRDGLMERSKFPWVPSTVTRHGESVYVASGGQVTRIQDGEMRSHTHPGHQRSNYEGIASDGDSLWIVSVSKPIGQDPGKWEGPLLLQQQGDEISQTHRLPMSPDQLTEISSVANGNDSVWIASPEGVLRFSDGEWSDWQTLRELPDIVINVVYRDRQDRLWLGGEDTGLYLDETDEPLRHFTTADGLASNTVLSVFESNQGDLWVGSPLGISRIRGEHIDHVNVGPFRDLDILAIVEDAWNRLWLGTRHGLYAVALEELERYFEGAADEPRVVRIGAEEGLENETVYAHYFPTATAGPDGFLYFCMEGGIARVDPANLPRLETGPRLSLQAASTATTRHLSGSAFLPPQAQQYLQFDYTTIGFTRPEKTRYHYRLKGLSDDWKSVGAQKHTIFPGLNPGAYEFQLKAYNGQQTRSAAIARWPFTVRPYLHQTWWFRLALLSAVAAILYGVYRYRLRWQLHTNALEKRLEMEEERSRIARDMHDEIGSALAQIGMLGQLAEQSTDPQKTNARIRTLAKHCSQSLREIIWSLTPQHNRIEDLEAYLRHYVDQALDGSGTRPSYQFNVAANLDTELSPATRRQLLLILKGILSNVLKHAQATEFRLSIESDENQLILKAQDNGIGFDPEQMPPDAIGLTTIRERAEQIQSSFEITTTEERGTRLILTIPLCVTP